MRKDTQHYVKRGLISQSDLDFLKELDPSPTKKYLPFIIKAYLTTGMNLDLLQSRVSEYDTLVSRNQVDRTDIYSFRTFYQLSEYVEKHNNIKSTREVKREIKKEADVILKTDDIFIVSPKTHAACSMYSNSTKWCISSTNSSHWDRYYYEKFISFYIIEARSNEIKKKIMETPYVNKVSSDKNNLREDLWKVGIAVYPNGKLEAYTALDKRIGHNHGGIEPSILLYHYLDAIGVDDSIFVPRGIEERLDDCWEFKKYDKELDLSKMGLTKIPDSIGENMFQLEKLILSENNLKAIPDSIGKLINLKTLYLFHNKLVSLPESLGNLQNLQWLGLTGNNISSRVLRELKRKLPATKIYMRQ